MKNNGASESHQNNCLKTNMAFATFLGPNVTFYDIRRRQQITQFLDTKIKSADIDPDTAANIMNMHGSNRKLSTQ